MKALNEEEDYTVPMTPMIDIVFQLLIFFLLASTVADEERDIEIVLSRGAQGQEQGAQAGRRLVIAVRQDGTYTLDGSVIEYQELRHRVVEAGRSNEKPVGTVRPDENAPHGKVAKIYQLFNEANIRISEDFIFDPSSK